MHSKTQIFPGEEVHLKLLFESISNSTAERNDVKWVRGYISWGRDTIGTNTAICVILNRYNASEFHGSSSNLKELV